MGVPSPVIPSFTDGSLVHATNLNALAQNLTNLYLYNQGGFNTQTPACLVNQTSGQNITNNTATTMSWNAAPINVGNMWVASQPTQITIQVAGIYFVFGQVRMPAFAGATLGIIARGNIMVNGTNPASNSVSNTDVPFMTVGNGTTSGAWYTANLAAGSTLYLSALQNTGGTVVSTLLYGGSSLACFFVANPT